MNPTATLTGSGTITGNVSGAGIVAPGDSTQTLTIAGNVTQSATTDLNLEVGGASPGTQFDRLVVSGIVTLGGNLNLSLISGFVPSQYESFRIIDNTGGSAVVGTFNGYAEGALIPVAGTQFQISYVGGTGNDVVLTVPIPDVILNSVTTNGSTTITVQYEIQHSALPIPLTIQFLQTVGAVESLLSARVISNPPDLIIGTHTLTYSLGSGAEVQLPGAGLPEDTSDYTLRAVADPVNTVNEVDAHPLNEDNSLTFVANYLSGKTVYLNAGSVADTVTITYPATKTGNTTLAITGSLNVTYTYLYNDVTQFRIRTHGGNDTVNVVNTANLTNRNMLVLGGDGDDVLSGGMAIDTINGGAGSDTITGNKGSDSLDGGTGNDRLEETADVNFVLTDTSLTGLGTDTLAGFELVQLTGLAGAKKFTVSGFTGTANLVGGGGGDTIIAVKNNNFTLTNSLLQATDGVNVSLTGFTKATLTGGDGNNSFEISTWTGAATLTGGNGTDTITATRDIDMTLSSKSLMTAGYGLVKLVTMESATLTGGVGNNTFTVSGWTGTGQLIGGGGTDTVVAVRNSNFTLSNSVLVAADGLNLSLTGISAAKLTGGKGNNSFTVTGWTGTGSLTGGGGTDNLIAVLSDDVSLSNSQFIVTGGMSMSISALSTAELTTGISNQILVTGGWQSTSLDQSGSTSVMFLKRSTK